MKRSVFPLVVLFCLFITFFSCSNKPKRSRKPVSTIVIQPIKNDYILGEKVSINVKTKIKDGTINLVQLYYNNQLVKESTELDFTLNELELNALGNNVFKVVATKTDKLTYSRSKLIPVVSDLVPEQFSYELVNNYPHQKTSYTQGLEFFKGFLYEGTGNEGYSKLMKINLATGNAVQSVDLNEKYFGEGISILNDKIYQLT